MTKSDPEDNGQVALIHGGTSLGRAVALEMARAGVKIALYDPHGGAPAVRDEVQSAGGEAVALRAAAGDSEAEAEALVAEAVEALGRLDTLIHIFIPDVEASPERIANYPSALLARGLAAARVMSAAGAPGTIINHCPLPAAYAGTRIDAYMPVVKGAITGVTRSLCRLLGSEGIRANCIQSGLIDVPEFKAIASPRVLEVKVPLGRWGRAEDFAKLVAFLALRKTYITGQTIIIDGGLTAGLTGT